MIISAKPFIKFKNLFKNKNEPIIYPWKDAVFFKNGTQALISVLRLLDLPMGSKVAIPAYICKSIPNALRSHGFEPCFFDVTLDLKISSEYLEKTFINEDISAFLLVDFFGFLSQENIKTSEDLYRKGYKVIIDRCHSGITKRDYKKDLTKASAIIFSLRKTFNSIDGGAYLANTNNKKVNQTKNSINISFIFIRFIETLVCKLGWPNIYSPFLDKYKSEYYRQDIEIKENYKNSHYLDTQISDLKNINHISTLRINNYNQLRLIFKNSSIKILFNVLDKFTIPQILPIIDETMSLKKHLRSNGIGAYSWPGHEVDSHVSNNIILYPNTSELNKKILCIPIHQSLKTRDIKYVNQKLKNWNSEDNE
jgi:dTDP-4-amino-4,6-dideoxygalactose transaminase